MKGVQANTRGIKVVFKEVYQVVVLFYNQFCVCLSLFAERLYNSNGRDLRRALFSLKQIFQVTHTHAYIFHMQLLSVCCCRVQLVIVVPVHFCDDSISINVAFLSPCVSVCVCVSVGGSFYSCLCVNLLF